MVLLDGITIFPFRAWHLSGSRRFVTSSHVFEKGREGWEKLFLSLEERDQAGMIEALHTLQQTLGN